MGTYGYCAPDYAMSSKLTIKYDIYTFGVVMLELTTGRKAIDMTKKSGEQNLVPLSRPFLKDRKKFVQFADPLLQGHFPTRCMHHAVAITAMCLQEQANFRPLIGDIVVALEYLASQTEISKTPRASAFESRLSPQEKRINMSLVKELRKYHLLKILVSRRFIKANRTPVILRG